MSFITNYSTGLAPFPRLSAPPHSSHTPIAPRRPGGTPETALYSPPLPGGARQGGRGVPGGKDRRGERKGDGRMRSDREERGERGEKINKNLGPVCVCVCACVSVCVYMCACVCSHTASYVSFLLIRASSSA